MKLNYAKLMETTPTVYDKITNSIGQEIEFVEHPYKGDEYPVIVVCHSKGMAFCSDFWETDDMMAEHKEYEPIINEDNELQYGV